MIRIVRLPLAVLVVSSLCTTALALPPLPPYVAEHYKSNPEYSKFAATFAALKMKCDTCHQPGADKKAKGHGLNDFGNAVQNTYHV